MSTNNGKTTNNSVAKTLQPFVCSMMAACLSSAVVHPIDLTKTRLQVAPKGTGVVQLVKSGVNEGGILNLYQGLSASLMRQAVYGTNRLALHRIFSDRLLQHQNDGGPLPLYKKVASSFASGAIASVLGNPFDVSLIRMQADTLKPAGERRNYKHVFDAVGRIVREEGVLNLWRGCGPTVVRAISMNVGMLASYDEAKEFYTKYYGVGLKTNMLSSATAGLCCSVLSLPFDLIKTQLQNMRPLPSGEMPYTGVVDCATKILKKDGLLSFWRGFLAYYGRTAPHAMISLVSLEQFNKTYRTMLLEEE